MTHEEFKAICMQEYPKIEGMVKTVKALGVDYVSCSVHSNGMINFDIHEKKDRSFHTSWHGNNPKDGNLYIVEYDDDHKSWWAPKCYYDHAIDDDVPDDGVDENLPF